nr:hypothetical protein [Tanacetum cinerariifolium]
MDNKKHIVNLESFREMFHICPRLPGQSFVEPPFEEEILVFLWFLGHSGAIRRLTDVEHKDTKKSNEMYYPRFTKVIIHHFMLKDPSIPKRNKVNWNYVRDDHLFTAIKLEYYAVATGVTLPKPKASVRKTRSSSDTTVTPSTAVTGPRLDDGEEGNDDDDDAQDDDDQEDEGNDKDDQEEGSDDEQAFGEEEFIHPSLSTHVKEETRDEESFDPILKTPKNTGDEGNGEENLGMNVGREERQDEEDEEDELYRDVNINLGRGIQMGDVHTTQEFEDSHVTLRIESIFETTSQMTVQTPISVAPLPVSAPTLTPSTIATITIAQQAPTPSTTAPSTLLQDLPNFGSLFGYDHRLKTLEANFFEFTQTNQFAGASDRLRDEAQAENDEFLKTIDENTQKIIKEQVKEQVKVQVSKILPKTEQTVNEQLEAKVLTWSSNSLKTSYAIAADLSEMELKKILIEKMEGNKSIHRSNEHRNLYKALVEAYESDKIILYTYRDTVTLKRRRDDADKDEKPSAGSDRGSKRRREGKEPESASAPTEKATRSAGYIQLGISDLAKLSDSRSSFNDMMDTPVDFSAFLINRLKVDTLTPKLLVGPIYELMKGSCKSLVELEFFLEEVYKATTDQLDWVNPEGQQYPHNLSKPLPLIPNSRGRLVIPFDHFINNDLEYLRRGASSRKYTNFVTKTKASNYGHVKWIEDLVPRKIIEIQRRVEDLQVGVESYQKKLNLTRPDSYRSDLKRKEAYIAYSNLRGFFYQNKDKQNRLRWIDELHKFSDGMLTNVHTTLDDRLKGIRIKYLPQTI